MKRLIIPFILIICLVFCACGEKPAVNYVLQEAVLDGTPVSGVSVNLSLCDDGTGTFSFNGSSCDVTWKKEPFTVTINSMEAPVKAVEGGLEMTMADTGLVLLFNYSADGIPEAAEPESLNYEGRFWFGDCEGIWAEYDGRSMALTGTVSDEAITLYNHFYSDTVPMLIVDLENGECSGGYVMNYALNPFDARITQSSQKRSEVNKTTFLNPEDYIWYVEPETTPSPEEMTDVITISGAVRNSEGGYSYEVNIIKASE